MTIHESVESFTDGARPFPGNDQVRASLLQIAADAGPPPSVRWAQQLSTRFPAGGALAEAKAVHPGGGIAHFQVLLANLSVQGMGLIWPGYLHAGTRCTFVLKTLTGTQTQLAGQVLWCRLLTSRFHEVGVELDSPVDPRDFIESAIWHQLASSTDQGKSAQLQGRVVCLEKDPISRQLVTMLLDGSGLALDFCSTYGEVLDAVRRSNVDVIIIESPERISELSDFTNSLNIERIMCPIMLFAPEGGTACDPELLAAGVSIVLCRPLRSEFVQQALRKLLQARDNPATGSAPIESLLCNDVSKTKWIEQFVQAANDMGTSLQSAMSSGSADTVMNICHTLMSSAGSYGFPLLVSTSNTALKAIASSGSVEESMPEIRAILRMIARLRAPGQGPKP